MSFTIREIEKTGRDVTIIKEVPDFKKDVPTKLALGSMLGWDIFRFNFTKEAYLAETNLAENIFAGIANRTAKVQFINPVQFLSDSNGLITPAESGGSFYRDSHHLSVYGSMRLKDAFKKLLNQNHSS